MNEQVAALRLAENDVQYLFDEIGSIIANSVSDSVKVPAGSAFFLVLLVGVAVVLGEVVRVPHKLKLSYLLVK